MTVTYIGSQSIEACIPGVIGPLLAAQADVQLKLTAMVDFSLKLGLPALSIAAQLELAAQITASLNAALALGITPPSINAQLSIVLDVIALLKIELQIFLDLFALLANAGVHVYTYTGQVNAFGGEMSTALAGGFPGGAPTDLAGILVLGSSVGATLSAMGTIFGVTL